MFAGIIDQFAKKKTALLYLLPALFLIVAIYLRTEVGSSHLTMVDPEYAYLYNGMNLAEPSMALGHTDHPGTPLQAFCAISIRITNFFIGSHPAIEDVLRNPELYISAITAYLLLINVILLFFLGRVVYKTTGSLIIAMFMQTTLFANHQVMTIVAKRLMPESMLAIVVIGILIIIFRYIDYRKNNNKDSFKFSALFGIAIGLGIAVKITFAPFFVVPFIILKGVKSKLLYFLTVILSFCIFIFPVFSYWVNFRNWVENLFIHSGRYGKGEDNFIDINTFLYNLGLIFDFLNIYYVLIFLSILTLVLYIFPKYRHNSDSETKIKIGLIAGILVVLLSGIFLTSKHFAFHYLTHVNVAITMLLFLSLTTIQKFFPAIKNKLLKASFLAVIFIFPFININKIFAEHGYFTNYLEERRKTKDFLATEAYGNWIVIVPNEYNSAMVEFGHVFGLAWCGEKKEEYQNILKKIHPKTLFYSQYNQGYIDWTKRVAPQLILKKNKKMYIYFADAKKEIEDYHINELTKHDTSISVEKIFFNPNSLESVYCLKSPEKSSTNEVVDYEIICDMELLADEGKMFVGSSGKLFYGGSSQSSDCALTGKFSSKLDNEFGVLFLLKNVKPNDHYKFSIWRKKTGDNDGLLVASANDSKKLYLFQAIPENENTEWEELVLDIIIPKEAANEEVKVYAYNPLKKRAQYFDNFTVTKYK